MSKFSEFLTTNKIHPNRVVTASVALESRTAEDKALADKKRKMKAGTLEKNAEVLKQKPRSGRPVTGATVGKALSGLTIGGPSKTRLVRAVNAVLAQKKKPEIGLRDLF